MRRLVTALALVAGLAGVGWAARTTYCKFNYTNYESENVNWDRLDALLGPNGLNECTTTTTVTTTTVSTTTTTT